MEVRFLGKWLTVSLVTGAVAPERLAPIRGSAERIRVACFVSVQSLVSMCKRVKGYGCISLTG